MERRVEHPTIDHSGLRLPMVCTYTLHARTRGNQRWPHAPVASAYGKGWLTKQNKNVIPQLRMRRKAATGVRRGGGTDSTLLSSNRIRFPGFGEFVPAARCGNQSNPARRRICESVRSAGRDVVVVRRRRRGRRLRPFGLPRIRFLLPVRGTCAQWWEHLVPCGGAAASRTFRSFLGGCSRGSFCAHPPRSHRRRDFSGCDLCLPR